MTTAGYKIGIAAGCRSMPYPADHKKSVALVEVPHFFVNVFSPNCLLFPVYILSIANQPYRLRQ